MHRRPANSIDGFSLRRRNVADDHATSGLEAPDKLPVPEQYLQPTSEASGQAHRIDQRPTSSTVGTIGTLAASQHVAKNDIDASLRAIDAEEEPVKKRRRVITKKTVKRMLLVIALLLLAGGGYFGYKLIFASGSIFQGNIFSVFQNHPLKKDSMGRSNILLFGTSEDDPGHADAGPDLTDSIMVLSVDQDKKNAVMFSVPRDLWVDYGQACLAGYEGKINALYQCAKQGSSDQTGANKLKSVVGEVFGLDIQYYAHVNYTALKQAVDAVGGVTVVIDSDDSRGVMDNNFDWQCGATLSARKQKCPPNGHMVDYPNGSATMDGDHALALARARNEAGGYGLSGGNFDREQYQQKILLAIKDKAVSAGTLANPIAVSNLIDSFGNNIRTNFDTSEIKTLVELANSVKKESIRSISLVDQEKPLVTTGQYSGQSIVRPVAGISDFSAIHAYIQAQLGNSNQASSSEAAKIEVLNGSDIAGIASKKQAELISKGINVTSIGDAPTRAEYGEFKWYDLSGGSMPQTAKKLTDVLGQGSSGSTLPSGVQSDANFVIIYGNGAN